MSENQVKQIFKKIATAIGSLHQRNILHRDIKIENILVKDMSDETDVCIADLGSATKL